MSEEIKVGECRIIKVEEVTAKGVTFTLSSLDFSEVGALYPADAFQGGYDSSPLRKLKMKAEIPYGKTFEIILREKEKTVGGSGARRIRTDE